jgi:N-acetylglucosamine-6-sulfatase
MRFLALTALLASLAIAAGFADQGSSAPARKPNIIFILTDDLSWNLVKYMPNVQRMQGEGATFENFFVTNSLCCPSRASILTGKYPHNTGIYANTGRQGGFTRFHDAGLESDTFATRLHNAGYTTALMGKYLNGYVPNLLLDGQKNYVPPGWDEWDVGGKAYNGFDYALNENHRVRYYGAQPTDYLTDVLAAKGLEFVSRAAATRRPFFLEIAPFTPHHPYTPAPRHEHLFPNVRAPRTPAFNEVDLSDKPNWVKKRKLLRSTQVSTIDQDFRKRVQDVQSIDELIGQLQDSLRLSGQLQNTYIFFTSDNGLHMGEHRLAPGKMTAYEPDIHIPLIATGPTVPAGVKLGEVTSTIDLLPTFTQLGGAGTPSIVDGRSLGPLLAGRTMTGWRKAVLIEHLGLDVTRGDPDFSGPFAGNPDSYKAVRTAGGTYVEYITGELEYYDLKKDPYELKNSAHDLKPLSRGALHSRLTSLATCAGAASCWAAGGGA